MNKLTGIWYLALTVTMLSACDVQPDTLQSPTTNSTATAVDAAIVPTPTSPLPADWVNYTSEDLQITIAIPPGWNVIRYDANHFDIRESESYGWLEVYTLDQSTGTNWGLVYTPGESTDAIIADLLSAARDDGTFAEPYQVDSRSGLDIWAFDGEYAVYSELTLIAVVSLDQNAVIVVGHQNGAQVDWATETKSLYLQIIGGFGL